MKYLATLSLCLFSLASFAKGGGGGSVYNCRTNSPEVSSFKTHTAPLYTGFELKSSNNPELAKDLIGKDLSLIYARNADSYVGDQFLFNNSEGSVYRYVKIVFSKDTPNDSNIRTGYLYMSPRTVGTAQNLTQKYAFSCDIYWRQE